MKKILQLLVISLFFTSCKNVTFPDSWYKTVETDLDFVKEKTEMKPFSHLKYPIVLSMTYTKSDYLFGVKNFGEKTHKDGEVFIVLDVENNKIFDWAYYPCEEGITLNEPVELGCQSVCYCSSGWNRGYLTILSRDTGKIDFVQYNKAANLQYCPSKSNYGLLYDLVNIEGHDEIQLDFFDLKNRCVNTDQTLVFPTIMMENNNQIIADENGNYVFTYQDGTYTYFYEIDVNTKKAELIEKREIDYEHSMCNLEYADEKYYLIVSHNESYQNLQMYPENLPKANRSVIELYDRNEKKVVKTMEIKYTDGSRGIRDVYKYGNKYYATVVEASMSEDTIQLYEIDMENNSYHYLRELNSFFMDQKYKINNRLYFFVENDPDTFSYFYYDFETNEISETVSLYYMDAIKEN